MRLNIKRLHPGAKLPEFATEGAACFDLRALVLDDDGLPTAETVEPRRQWNAPTGLAFEVPEGWAMLVFSRSGHGFRYGVRLANGVGVIDSDYRGEVRVALRNDGNVPLHVEHGDRIAQAMLVPLPAIEFHEVSELAETLRGAGGFGSTGK